MPNYICKCGHEDDEQTQCPYCGKALVVKTYEPVKPVKTKKKTPTKGGKK